MARKNLDLLLTVEWKDDAVVMVDQTKLPNRLAYVKCTDYLQVADAIKKTGSPGRACHRRDCRARPGASGAGEQGKGC